MYAEEGYEYKVGGSINLKETILWENCVELFILEQQISKQSE